MANSSQPLSSLIAGGDSSSMKSDWNIALDSEQLRLSWRNGEVLRNHGQKRLPDGEPSLRRFPIESKRAAMSSIPLASPLPASLLLSVEELVDAAALEDAK